MSLTHRILTGVGSLVATFVVAVGLAVFGVFGAGPRVFHYQVVTVLTGSMRPGRPPGSVLLETQSRTAAVRVGEIITYRIPVQDHRVVTHRVVEIVEAGPQPVVRTKGDANTDADPWTARLTEPTTWEARLTIPRLGFAITWLRRPRTSRTLVLIVPLVVAVLWLNDIWSDDENSPSSSLVPSLSAQQKPSSARALADIVTAVGVLGMSYALAHWQDPRVRRHLQIR